MRLSERIRNDVIGIKRPADYWAEKVAQLEAELKMALGDAKNMHANWDAACNDLAQLEAELAAHRDNEGDECPLCQCEAELEKYRTKFADNTCAECLLYGIECDCDALKEGE